jgi:hypothetical protein
VWWVIRVQWAKDIINTAHEGPPDAVEAFGGALGEANEVVDEDVNAGQDS